MDWTKAEEGSRVVAKYRGEKVPGVFVAACGGRDKGKLRINLDGDDAQYREIKEKDVELYRGEKVPGVSAKDETAVIEIPKQASDEEKPQCDPVPENVADDPAYLKLARRVRKFRDGCDQHVTREEIQKAFGDV